MWRIEEFNSLFGKQEEKSLGSRVWGQASGVKRIPPLAPRLSTLAPRLLPLDSRLSTLDVSLSPLD